VKVSAKIFLILVAQLCGFLACLCVCVYIYESVVDLITLWNRVILQKLTVLYIVKFLAFHATGRFVALLKRKGYRSLL
jgi:hypothetical protein